MKFQKSIYFSRSLGDTERFAKDLAKSIMQKPSSPRGAFVIGLQGNLGAGKTTFAKGFAKGLGVRERVASPTFLIMRRYELKKSSYKTFYHIDCYRLLGPAELLALGWGAIVKGQKAIILVEWSERIKTILPRGTVSIKLTTTGKTQRTIALRGPWRG